VLLVAATALLAWLTDRIYRRIDRRPSPRSVPAVGPVSA